MTKQQQINDDLFGGIDIADFEESIMAGGDGSDITFDPENPGDDVPGGGDTESEKKVDKPKDQKPEPEIDLIDVDKGTEQDDTGDDKIKSADTKGGSAPDNESESPVYLHAAALQENGVLPNFDLNTIKDLEPAEAILKINEHIQTQIEESIKEGVNEYKGTIGEKAAKFIESLEKGIPFEDLAENYTLEERFGSITQKELETNEQLAEAVYKDYLSMKGFSDVKINKMIAIAKGNEELVPEALESLEEIKGMIQQEREEMVKQVEQERIKKEENNLKIKEKINKSVNDTKEIIPGVEVTDNERKELIKMMTVPVRFADGPNGQKIPVSKAMDLRSKDPVAYELRLNYLISKGFFEDDLKNIKLETFLKKQETNATKKLIDKISRGPELKGGKAVIPNNQEKTTGFVFPQNISI